MHRGGFCSGLESLHHRNLLERRSLLSKGIQSGRDPTHTDMVPAREELVCVPAHTPCLGLLFVCHRVESQFLGFIFLLLLCVPFSTSRVHTCVSHTLILACTSQHIRHDNMHTIISYTLSQHPFFSCVRTCPLTTHFAHGLNSYTFAHSLADFLTNMHAYKLMLCVVTLYVVQHLHGGH